MRSFVFAKGARPNIAKENARRRNEYRGGSPIRKRNEVIRKLGFTSYREYLKSDLWKGIRDRVLEARPNCERCGGEAQCVHHARYTLMVMRGQKIKHLVSLCHDCHRFLEYREDGTKRNFEAVHKRTRKLVRKRSQNQ